MTKLLDEAIHAQMVREESTSNHQTINEQLDKHSSELSFYLRFFHPRTYTPKNISKHFSRKHNPSSTLSGYWIHSILYQQSGIITSGTPIML